MSSFIDSGTGLVLSMVCFSHSIEQQKQVYNYEAKDVGVIYNEPMNLSHAYRHLLTNR